jgi:hypothetical protein
MRAEVIHMLSRNLSSLCALSVVACGAMVDEPLEQRAQDIVRGSLEPRRPQVVAVHVGSFFGRTLCSGTYIAPRVVLTAAHCMTSAIPGQTFVYHGSDYLADVAMLPNIPAPGNPSVWAHGETTTVHPAYDPGLNHPDLAVVFLDRELPFAALPPLRKRVSDSVRKAEIVGWGGSRALTADISVVEGAGIKRSAQVKLLGAPTEADFHADDPNPGILVPEIRADLLKTDGEDPKANPCAGDSGGPLIIKHQGKDHVAGVSMWTGLFCEDYSIYTRIDPFLDFIDEAIERSGRAPVVPRLECLEEAADGSLSAHFGYRNDNGVSVDIPYGARNLFPADRARNRPSAFAPGNNPFDFSLGLDPGEQLFWFLAPRGGPLTLVRADASSPRCDPNDGTLLCANQCEASLAAECSDGTASRGQCLSDCSLNATFFADVGCASEWNAALRCVAAVPPDAANWDCSFAGLPPFPLPPHCDLEFSLALACAGF